ncbi:hypothetical protein AQULUS_14060 [Aquicella lusitana]|uniref:Uncharacterized protein n=2 Tax=Aquicella lusitana TaxID=254246 RepID=A0A370G5H1_9COXI|nr:hypothetical protein C8D86_1298 [Aquicella lusitana]VVC73659.1 hypothetical protein AQULUS_14060 [Aquicella lusitana]
MRTLAIFSGLSALIISLSAFAGSMQIMIDCQSSSKDAKISGYMPGDGMDYDVKITIDDATLRYVNACVDAQCSNVLGQGVLLTTHHIKQRIFTIAFANLLNAELTPTGSFYAIPSTVKTKRDGVGYSARYKAVYYGLDPRSTDTPKALLKKPIELMCKHRYGIR